MSDDRIELHEFLKLIEAYYRYSSPWTKTYEELSKEILRASGCSTLLQAVTKAGIERMCPGIEVRILPEGQRRPGLRARRT